MQKLLIPGLFALSIFLIGATSVAKAQSAQDSTVIDNGNITEESTIGATDQNERVDWRWALPLLGIPLLFLLARRSGDNEINTFNDRRFAGSKGGEARRRRDEDFDDELF